MMETKPEKRWASAPALLPESGEPEGLGALAETVRSFFFVMFRHRRLVTVFFLAVVLAAFLGVLFSGRSYTSEAKLIVRMGRESVTVDPAVGTGVPLRGLNKDWENEVNSELEILKSEELMEGLVDAIGVKALLSGGRRREPKDPVSSRRYAEALTVLQRNLGISVYKKADIIQISYKAARPELAQEVVNRLIDLYLVKHMAVRQATGSYEFFQEQTAKFREDLDKAEIALRNFKNVFGIASLDEQQSLTLNRVRELRDRLNRAAAERVESQARTEAIESLMGESGEAPVRRTMLASKDFQDMHSNLLEERTKLASLSAQMGEVRRQLTDLEREQQNLNDSETRIRGLERDRELLLTKYTKYSESLEQVRINRALDEEKVSNIGIVQRASRPLRPNPRWRLIKLIVAALVGLGGAVMLAFVCESLDHSLRRPEEVETRLGLPALTFLPLMDGSRLAPFARGIQSTSWDTPRWASEHLGMLYDRIGRALTPSLVPPVVLGVTACRQGEGVTGVASTLALTLVRRRPDARVLYVDANAQVEPERRVFGLRQAGAVELEVREDGGVTATERQLNEALTETQEGSTTAPTVYDHWMPLIRKHDYSFVVFDMPPISEERSAMQLGGSMDGIIVVVEAERVRREIVQRSLALLREAKANLLGVVLNKRQFHVPDWLYQRL